MIAGLPPLGWIGILRLGLVQTALGAIVVLTISTLNRVMVVELALAPRRLFFLIIIVPVILLLFVVHGLFSRWAFNATGRQVVGATASAIAFAWAIAVTFPVVIR